jgi:hypothetical protein
MALMVVLVVVQMRMLVAVVAVKVNLFHYQLK